jgi:hypothetical protein
MNKSHASLSMFHSDIRSDNDLRVALLQAAEALTPGRREGAAAKLILKLGSSQRNKPKSHGEHNLFPMGNSPKS